MIRTELLTTRYGNIYVPSDDPVIGRSFRLYGEWAQQEIDYLAQFLTDGETFIDVGAHIGAHSLAFAAKFPNSVVVSFEPQPAIFPLLAANALTNNYRNIRPHNIGCAELPKLIFLDVDYGKLESNTGAVNLEKAQVRHGRGSPTILTPLDLASLPEPVGLIKIDVEGMEADVLAGARQTMQRSLPYVYFEILDIEKLAPARDLLLELGYQLFWLETSAFNPSNFKGEGENIWSACELGILAVPKHRSQPNLLPVSGDERQLPRDIGPVSVAGEPQPSEAPVTAPDPSAPAQGVTWRSFPSAVFPSESEPQFRGDTVALPGATLREASSVADLGLWYSIGEAWSHLAVSSSTSATPNILDIACGCGKMARFFVMNPSASYLGLDTFAPAIRWCQEAFSKLDRFRFEHLDIKSELYNPTGSLSSDEVVLPVNDEWADIIICGSLFTHLLEGPFRNYMAEVKRCLGPEGQAVISIHNDPNNGRFSGAETRIDVSDEYFIQIAAENGLRVQKNAGNVFGQQVYILVRA